MNEVYVSYFSSNPPTLSALGSSGLALGARTEIEYSYCKVTTTHSRWDEFLLLLV